MTRILTIIALLFATPALAETRFSQEKLNVIGRVGDRLFGDDNTLNCATLNGQGCITKITIDNVEVVGRWDIISALNLADPVSFVVVYTEDKQVGMPRKYFKLTDKARLSDSTKAKIEASKLRMQRARERENELNAAKIRRRLSSSYGDLQDRVDELEAEVEQLRNR